MSDVDRTTIKTRAYSGPADNVVPQNTLTEEQNNALEMVKNKIRLEEEKNKSLECLKTIEQLQESLKQEQVKTAGMTKQIAGLEAKVKELTGLKGNEN